MGRMAIIIVMGLALTLGIVSYSLNKSKSGVIENVSGFHKYTTARDIAHTGVNMMLRRFDRTSTTQDTSFTKPLGRGETVWLVTNTMSGVCSVSVKMPNIAYPDTLDLTSRSQFMDTSYSMQVKLLRYPKPFPAVNAAVGLASYPVEFKMSGNAKIDGRNYNMDGTLNTNRATDTIAVAVLNAAESTVVAAYASKITGDPKVAVQPPINPTAYISQYIAAADYIFPNGSNNNGVYGDSAAPVIGYCDGSTQFAGNGKFYGILVVKRGVKFAGTFTFYGLLLAVGDTAEVEVEAETGTPQIYGGVLVAGPVSETEFELKGTPLIAYSTEALNKARYIGKLQAYRVLRWYE